MWIIYGMMAVLGFCWLTFFRDIFWPDGIGKNRG